MDTEEFLEELAERFALPRELVTPEAGLWDDLGLDSLDAARLLAWLEDQCGVLTAEAMPELHTVADLLDHRRTLQEIASAAETPGSNQQP